MTLRVGLLVGRGTGSELAQVFEIVILRLAALYSTQVEIHRSPRIYHSYFSLLKEHQDGKEIEDETSKDVNHFEEFCLNEAAQGTRATFKTAINAQSLYLIREHLQAVKVECFNQGENSLLLVRDQSQGFYTGSNTHSEARDSVSRNCKFEKSMTSRIVGYSISRAREIWGADAVTSVSMVYKFHLFDGLFSAWATSLSEEHKVKVEFVQPDTANRNLLAFGVRGRQLMIAGNEWADIMHVMLLHIFGQGAQEARCTENIYLHPDTHLLHEYQTVHGSADDIEGKGVVNPSATIRAAAAILERQGGCKGAEGAIDKTLSELLAQDISTPDQGGKKSTNEVVEAVLEALRKDVPNGISSSSTS